MEWIGLIGVSVAALAVGWVLARRGRGSASAEAPVIRVEPLAPSIGMAAPASGFNRPLEKTRSSLAAKLSQFLRSDRQLDQAVWEGLEEALLTSDVGVSTTQRLLGAVKGRATGQDTTALRSLLVDEAIKLFPSGRTFPIEPRPLVISIVGVNGAGKTTTIGKLCARFSREGKNVLVGAADTFRAAATEQLKVWAQRAGADFVSGREGADPAAVAFDSVSAGKARGKDVVIIDTAGRLHTKENLMEELKKVHRVIKKVMPEAPHEVLLVLDGTTGQNALAQARQFSSDLGVTGLIVTKLDGTAKGGAVLGICSELAVPVRFVGVGEKSEDLIDFNDRQYVEALLEA